MKIRTVIALLLWLFAIIAIIAVFETNREVMGQEIVFRQGLVLTVGKTLILFFLIGALVTFIVGISREVGRIIEHGRLRRANRKSEEIEEQYSKGLIAVLEGHEEEALGHFRAVLEQDSRHFNSLLKMGEILRDQEKFAEAI